MANNDQRERRDGMGETSDIFVTRKDGTRVGTGPGYIHYTLINPDMAGTKNLTVSYLDVSPGARTLPAKHPNTEEVFYITRGSGTMKVDGETREVRKGDAIFISANLWHQFENTGREPMEWVCIYPADLTGSQVAEMDALR